MIKETTMFKFLFGESKKECPKESDPVGHDLEGNPVFRCDKTKLLFVWGEIPKKYVSVKDVTFIDECLNKKQ